jgi:glycosyltransferase involved in cell wall biosynthesis
MESVVILTKFISVIIPAYNEEACLEELTSRLKNVFKLEAEYEFEVIIIENGSIDATWDICKEISNRDSRFKILKLSRNFRMDGGLTAGLSYVTGDACIFMTADLQDPPEMISEFLRKWEQGFQNVYGKIISRKSSKFLRRINSRLFYFIANKFAKDYIISGVSDFRLMDKRAYEALRNMPESNRFMRAMSAWVGFKSIGIELERPPRFGGKSNADTFKVLDLAIKGILAFSNLPLRIGTLLGSFLFLVSFVTLPFFAFFWIIKGVPFAGFGSIITIFLILFSTLTVIISLIGEYIGLIYDEVKMRPKFIVEEKIRL